MPQTPFHPLIGDFLLESGWVPRNQANAISGLNGFGRWLTANHPGVELPAVEREHCRGYLEHRAGIVKPATVMSDWRYLKALFAWLADEGELTGERRSPMTKYPMPRVATNPRTRVATDAEVEQLLAAIPRGTFNGRRDALAVSLMWRSGCRVGELPFIDLDHVDERAGLITLPQTKTDRVRRIPIHPDTARLLARYMRSRRPHGPGPLLLSNGARSTAQRMTVESIQTAFKRWAKAAGVPVSPHQLRRAFAVNWMRAGGSASGLQVVGGWTDSRMVLRYQGERAEEVAAEEFFRLVGTPERKRRLRAV